MFWRSLLPFLWSDRPGQSELDSASSVGGNVPLQTPGGGFTVFSDLPVEIQLMVWKLAVSNEAKPRPYKFQAVISNECKPIRYNFQGMIEWYQTNANDVPPRFEWHLKPDKTMSQATRQSGLICLDDLTFLFESTTLLGRTIYSKRPFIQPDAEGRLPLLSQWRLTIQNLCLSKEVLDRTDILDLGRYGRHIITSIPSLVRLIVDDSADEAQYRASKVSQQLWAENTPQESHRVIKAAKQLRLSTDLEKIFFVFLNMHDFLTDDGEGGQAETLQLGFMAIDASAHQEDLWVTDMALIYEAFLWEMDGPRHMISFGSIRED
ncbi:hypothetical protein J7T55_012732 [Diaporthe amygdali]|uniref:uncharacterized protein n=1 Tax=Phomopsis amygdali TaxID=1214568 RepID=UPI0022FE05EC|nr:uncharacterized protein J7T55_012732 [Diaporthe amygdali]KAJ0115452.1 hypothetical protein J7T55_012732 [Diaporthe amygdali]